MKRHAGTRWIVALFALCAGGAGAGTAVLAAGAGASTPASSIKGNAVLTSGQSLQSADGQYQLSFTNGILTEKIVGGRTLWSAGSASAGAEAKLQSNGEFVIVSAAGQVLWSSNKTGTGCPSLVLQSDGNLADYDPSTAIWDAGTARHGLSAGDRLDAGWTLMAYGSKVQLTMQTDGNLVLRNSSGTPEWSSGTSKNPGAYAILQADDGNFVVYSAAGKALWNTGTAGNPGDVLTVQSDDNLVLTSKAGKVLWDSGTAGKQGTGAGYTDGAIDGSPTPCPAPVAPTLTVTAPPVTVTTTATVTVPTTTVVTVTNPTSTRHRRVSVPVRFSWRWKGRYTYLSAIRLGTLPRGAHVKFIFDPDERGHRDTVKAPRTARSLAATIRFFERIHYRSGQHLEIEITRRGYEHEYGLFTIRTGHLPALRAG